MCYERRHRDLDKEARRITENRLMEEEVRLRHEEHRRRMGKENKPLTGKAKEMVGAR